ncbi:MAG: response regulator transcription factor [Bacteroidetes bacterium]|nr:response regulator transcription factor [Bacteroidota bacterium]
MKKNKANILLVEDDHNLGFMLKDFLSMEGYMINLQRDGKAGMNAFRSQTFDLCILDIMMPVQDGFSLAQEIRKADSHVPIVFLTAKTMEQDRIRGFKLGADDYITKPFSTEELKLRLEVILKRSAHIDGIVEKEEYKVGNYTFDFANQILKHSSGDKKLTNKEALVFRLLCRNINQLVRTEVALTSIWGADDYFMGRSMDVYIAKLRSYLKNDPTVSILNVHGTGFKLESKKS